MYNFSRVIISLPITVFISANHCPSHSEVLSSHLQPRVSGDRSFIHLWLRGVWKLMATLCSLDSLNPDCLSEPISSPALSSRCSQSPVECAGLLIPIAVVQTRFFLQCYDRRPVSERKRDVRNIFRLGPSVPKAFQSALALYNWELFIETLASSPVTLLRRCSFIPRRAYRPIQNFAFIYIHRDRAQSIHS